MIDMNVIPLILLTVFILFLIAFFKLEAFRKYRVWFKIRWNYGMRTFKHLYYEGLYLIRLTAFLKTLLFVGIGLGFIFLLIITIIFFWNEYIVFAAKYFFNVEIFEIKLPEYKELFSRFNIFWIFGAIGGSLLSVFIKPKLEKFADKVNAKQCMIYIFGSNTLAQKIVNEFIKLGIGPMVALIADKKYYWIEDLGKAVDILILDSPEELRMPTIYDKIKFKNALKVISLVDSPEDNQHIILNVRRNNPDVEIIVLSRNKPHILDLVGQNVQNITVIEDLDTITREIIRRLALGFIHAPVIESYVPEDYIGKTPKVLESDFNGKIKILGVKRGGEIVFPETLDANDRLIIYLMDDKILKEFLQLLPVTVIKGEVPIAEESERRQGLESKVEEQKEEEVSLLEKLKKE